MIIRSGTFCSSFCRSSFRYSKASVSYTSDVFKTVKRGPYKTLCDKDFRYFESVMEKHRIIADEAELESYNIDWMKSYKGKSRVVLKPKSCEEVLAIVRYCNEHKLAIVPQGGNTGLVGGSVPVFDEIIISMSLMNRIHSIDAISGVAVCEAGVILEKLNEAVAEKGLIVPVDLGAKGTCQIGGNVATNAGGIRLLRYGGLHGNVLGLRAVVPQNGGQIIDLLTGLRKDNTGYDLKQLFIGAEGTLGIITDVSILCPAKSNSVNVAFLGCNTFENALETFKLAKSSLGEVLSAFELMDKASIQSVRDNLGFHQPLPSEHEFYLLIETSGSNEEHDQEKLSSFLADILDRDFVQDGALAQDSTQANDIWKLRETINPSCQAAGGYVHKFDFTAAISVTWELINMVKQEFSHMIVSNKTGELINIVGYGHMGDGNLHLNLVAPKYNPDLDKKLEKFVYGWLRDHRGSISAEHGLGFKKAPYIRYSKSEGAVNLMRDIKQVFDPNSIMNPYKILRN